MTVPGDPSPGPTAAPVGERSRRRDTVALGVGSALNGLLAYVFFALATRTLGPAEAAPVSILWTYWSLAAAALTFPVQHWIARTVAAHGGERAVRSGISRVAAAVSTVALAATVLAWLAREPLFDRPDAWFPLLVGMVTLGSGLVGVVRGVLAARHRFVSLAAAVTAENLLRCAAAGVLVVSGTESALGFGLCLAAGPAVVLGWPSTLRLASGVGSAAIGSPITFLSAASGGQLTGQAVLTGSPLVVALSGGSPTEVTAMFAALALFRAPYTLSLGVLSQLTGVLTSLVVRRDTAALRRTRLALLAGTTGAVMLAALVGTTIGPSLVEWVFGADVQVPRLVSVLVAVGSAFAIASLTGTITVMALNRPTAVLLAWLAAAAAGGAAFVGSRAVADGALEPTSWAFLAAEVVAFAALVRAEVHGTALLDKAAGRPSRRPR